MKQVVFAIALLAMASLTGCLNTDDTSVDENTDTTSDTTQDDGLIEPVGVTGYTPPDKANITVNSESSDWVAKDGNRITTSCIPVYTHYGNNIAIYDSNDRIIYLANDKNDYGASECEYNSIIIDVTLGPEPVKVALTIGYIYPGDERLPLTNHFSWVVTF